MFIDVENKYTKLLVFSNGAASETLQAELNGKM
jgi:hypothetical protein